MCVQTVNQIASKSLPLSPVQRLGDVTPSFFQTVPPTGLQSYYPSDKFRTIQLLDVAKEALAPIEDHTGSSPDREVHL